MGADWRSPNHGPRRGDARPDLVVLHYTAMESCAAAAERLCDPAAEVSAHYLISERGEVITLVAETERAWHAGAGSWGSVTDVNSRSIGVELANTGAQPFPDLQMRALERLLAEIMVRWQIPPERVIAHSDMAPSRKSDPGPRFDWRRLALQGLSVWPATPRAAPLPALGFAEAAGRFGYPADARPEDVLSSFRMRFRPGASGPLAPEDCAALADLALRFPAG